MYVCITATALALIQITKGTYRRMGFHIQSVITKEVPISVTSVKLEIA